MEKPVRIIGIGGISQSGKSSVSKQLAEYFLKSGRTVTVFDTDDYVLPPEKIPKINGVTDWELPESIDWKRVISEVLQCQSEIIIVEGIFTFCEEAGEIPFDYRILVSTNRDIFLSRRKKDTRWGDEPDWYLDHVWDSNQKMMEKARPDFELDGTIPLEISTLVNQLLH